MRKEIVAFFTSNSEMVAQIPAQKILGKGEPVSVHKLSSSRHLLQGISSSRVERLGRAAICWLPPPARSSLAPRLRKPTQDFSSETQSPRRPAAASHLASRLAEPEAARGSLNRCRCGSKPNPWHEQPSRSRTRMMPPSPCDSSCAGPGHCYITGMQDIMGTSEILRQEQHKQPKGLPCPQPPPTAGARM